MRLDHVEWEEMRRQELAPKIQEARSKRKSEEKIIEYKRRTAAHEQDPKIRDKLLIEVSQLEAGLTEVPVLPQLFANDATPESLAMSVYEQGGRFAVISDEGGITETLGGLYSGGAANVDILLKGIDGGVVRSLRRDRAHTYDLNPILTIVLTVQPQILVNIASKRAFRGNGLIERFLFLLPKSKVGFRNNDGKPIPEGVASAYNDLIRRLLAVEPGIVNGVELSKWLTLEAQAAEVWRKFREDVERDLRPDGRLRDIPGWGAKLPGFTLRIAGLLHPAANPVEQGTIRVEMMNRAVSIAWLLVEHALAVHDLMGVDEATEDAKVLYDWIAREGAPAFTRTDCLRPYHGRFKQKKRLDAALQVLVDRRIVSRRVREETRRPGRPAEIYDVNPLIFDRKGGGV